MFTVAYASPTTIPDFIRSSGLINFLPMIAIFIIFYFFLIKPQMVKERKLKDMLALLNKGEEVVTVGGIIGKIYKIEDETITLEVDKGIKIQVLKSSVIEKIAKK
jgi:preprotein translocase subunit YajC